jgi:hypothetical protein
MRNQFTLKNLFFSQTIDPNEKKNANIDLLVAKYYWLKKTFILLVGWLISYDLSPFIKIRTAGNIILTPGNQLSIWRK